MMFPYYHTQSIHDGLISEGETDVIQLTRSAWAGMQRFGAALWSGDTSSHWSSLKVSIQAGLNTQMSGIAWWTTDIGGYSGGNPSDPGFRELIVRWFQFGLTCPLFRQVCLLNIQSIFSLYSVYVQSMFSVKVSLK